MEVLIGGADASHDCCARLRLLMRVSRLDVYDGLDVLGRFDASNDCNACDTFDARGASLRFLPDRTPPGGWIFVATLREQQSRRLSATRPSFSTERACVRHSD